MIRNYEPFFLTEHLNLYIVSLSMSSHLSEQQIVPPTGVN